MSEMFIDNIGHKTRRGQIEAVHDHRLVSPIVYGYRSANVISDGGKLIRGMRVVHPREADVVRRIYRLYLDGMSPRQIARLLNREGVPGNRNRPWTDNAVRGRSEGRGILRNEIYRGLLIYGRTRSRRHPATGRRHYELRPREEWTIVEAPELRIVDDSAWQAVQEEAKRRGKRHHTVVTPQRKAAYPLTARVRCGQCGARMTIAGNSYYRCLARQHNPASCGNSCGIRLQVLEDHAVRQLFEWMLSPDRDWRRLFAESEVENNARRRALREKADDANAGIARLVAAIESGLPSTSIRERLLELERDRNEALAALEGLPVRPPSTAFGGAAFIRDHLVPLRRAVTGDRRTARREEALLVIRDLIATIDVRPCKRPRRVAVETTPDIPAILGLIARQIAAEPAAEQRTAS